MAIIKNREEPNTLNYDLIIMCRTKEVGLHNTKKIFIIKFFYYTLRC